MRAVAFKTHTGLLIALETQDKEHVVTVTGDRVKELLHTPDEAAAIRYAEGLQAQYKQRAEEEAGANVNASN